MSNWTQACCDACWWKRNRQPPVRLQAPSSETCCYCGVTTQSGIYVRVNPLSVPFSSQ